MTFSAEKEKGFSPERQLYSFVPEKDHGIQLLDFLSSRYSRFDRNGWEEEIKKGKVQREGKVISFPFSVLKKHDKISYFPGDLPEPEADLAFKVHYEDEYFLVLEKSGSCCVHPTGPFFKHTLWYQASRLYGELKFVQRLDKETSGLIIAARSGKAAAAMDNNKTAVHKEYLALVHGNFYGRVHAQGYLRKDTKSSVAKKKRFFFAGNDGNTQGERAETILIREKAFPREMTLVRAFPITGRQHQIRATLYSLGFPLAGDKLYGRDETLFHKIKTNSFTGEDREKLFLPRQALHCTILEFIHPFTGGKIRCESPWNIPVPPEKSSE